MVGLNRLVKNARLRLSSQALLPTPCHVIELSVHAGYCTGLGSLRVKGIQYALLGIQVRGSYPCKNATVGVPLLEANR